MNFFDDYTEQDAYYLFKRLIWGDGPLCPNCDIVMPASSSKTIINSYQCTWCLHIISVFKGTPLYDSRLSSLTWLNAFMSIHTAHVRGGIFLINPPLLCKLSGIVDSANAEKVLHAVVNTWRGIDYELSLLEKIKIFFNKGSMINNPKPNYERVICDLRDVIDNY